MSFFGFDARLPERRGGDGDVSRLDGDLDLKLEQMRLAAGEDLQVYDFGQFADDDDDDDDGDDETFAVSVPADRHFDFAAAQKSFQPPSRTSAFSTGKTYGGLGDLGGSSIWSSLPSQQSRISAPASAAGLPSQDVQPKDNVRRGLTLEELEDSFERQEPNLLGQQPHPPASMTEKETAEQANPAIVSGLSEEAIRKKRASKIAELSRDNGLMTNGDKDYIKRIQLSQLYRDTKDPYREDFYAWVWTSFRRPRVPLQGPPPMPPPPHTGPPPVSQANMSNQPDQAASAQWPVLGQRGPVQSKAARRNDPRNGRRDATSRGAEMVMTKMQQQVQKMVDSAKKKPKHNQMVLEGALGKVTSLTTRAPRQVLSVNPTASARPQNQKTQDGSGQTATEWRETLRSIESVYDAVLELEQLNRVQPIPSMITSQEAQEGLDRWHRDYQRELERMWRELKVMEPLGISYPHPFIAILAMPKGKRLIPRVARHLSTEQTLTILTMLIANFESLDIVKDAIHSLAGPPPPSVLGAVDLFMQSVVPPLLAVLTEAPLRIVSGLFGMFLERNNVVWVARSKVGLAFMTIFLSRAEILKQGDSANPGELELWQNNYNTLFSRLQGNFLSIFPPSMATSNGLVDRHPSDDIHAWQFLAATAVSADTERQHSLVTEVREKVLEKVLTANRKGCPPEEREHALISVNLFLHALGLDASQIQTS